MIPDHKKRINFLHSTTEPDLPAQANRDVAYANMSELVGNKMSATVAACLRELVSVSLTAMG